MSIRTVTIVLFVIVLAGLGFSLWAGPRLPQAVPSHWNAAGQVDGFQQGQGAAFGCCHPHQVRDGGVGLQRHALAAGWPVMSLRG